jgi:hypothetical protein
MENLEQDYLGSLSETAFSLFNKAMAQANTVDEVGWESQAPCHISHSKRCFNRMCPQLSCQRGQYTRFVRAAVMFYRHLDSLLWAVGSGCNTACDSARCARSCSLPAVAVSLHASRIHFLCRLNRCNRNSPVRQGAAVWNDNFGRDSRAFVSARSMAVVVSQCGVSCVAIAKAILQAMDEEASLCTILVVRLGMPTATESKCAWPVAFAALQQWLTALFLLGQRFLHIYGGKWAISDARVRCATRCVADLYGR